MILIMENHAFNLRNCDYKFKNEGFQMVVVRSCPGSKSDSITDAIKVKIRLRIIKYKYKT
jgi:predicted Zn-ribbon and HTH transcriptional regulator